MVKSIIIVTLLSSVLTLMTIISYAQSPQAILGVEFDIVETFDELKDWRGSKAGDVVDIKDMPKSKDGSNSLWGYYSYWNSNALQTKWISNHGIDKVWNPCRYNNPKSLAIDLGKTGFGPNRLGLFMGQGYREIFLFYMVNIPNNTFPTEIDSRGVGKFIPGKPYVYFASWKFGNFNLNCKGPLCNGSAPNYGEWYFTPHIKVHNHKPNMGLTFVMEAKNHLDDKIAVDSKLNLNNYIGDWFGVEWHIKNNDDGSVSVDIWTYSKNGEHEIKRMDNKIWNDYDTKEKRWNNYMFGGNNSTAYIWGDSMTSVYYIDDFIIDDARIGPRYFEIINKKCSTE